jgi:hydrogenase maturation protease
LSDTTTVRSDLDDVPQTSRPLVVGYGNPLRCDDAIGWRAALALAEDPRLAGVDVLARHQLTPELAVDVAAASRAVFVDAREEAGNGDGARSVSVVEIAPEATALAWTHHLDAAALLGLSADLYGATPPALLVTAPAESLEVSEELSVAGEQMLGVVIETVVGLLQQQEGAGNA